MYITKVVNFSKFHFEVLHNLVQRPPTDHHRAGAHRDPHLPQHHHLQDIQREQETVI